MPTTITVQSKIVAGISVRTTNAAEMDPATARLPGLWGRFYQEELAATIPGARAGSPVYGVYSAYESDANGAYTVTAGVEIDPRTTAPRTMTPVTLAPGRYMVFEGRGEMPAAVIDTWLRVWNFFATPGAPARAYTTDFEVYSGPGVVDIHIALK